MHKKILQDKAIRKTITYRIAVLIGAGLIFIGSWFAIPNPAGAITSGFIVSEVYRSGIYYAHEKIWEKDKKKEPEQEGLHEYHKKYGVDELHETRR